MKQDIQTNKTQTLCTHTHTHDDSWSFKNRSIWGSFFFGVGNCLLVFLSVCVCLFTLILYFIFNHVICHNSHYTYCIIIENDSKYNIGVWVCIVCLLFN